MAAHLFSFLILLLLIEVSRNEELDYVCPGVINAPQYYRGVHFEPIIIKQTGQTGQSRDGFEKMRFRIFYDESADKLPLVFKSLTQEAVDCFSDALSVRPYDGTMFIERQCEQPVPIFTYSNVTKKHEQHCFEQCANRTICVDTVVPEDHLKECTYCSSMMNVTECHTTGQRGKGIENVDMVFYVSALQTKHCDRKPIAYAGSCNTESYLDRPIVGGINICPLEALRQLKTKKEHIVSVIKHEMMHALGFVTSSYNYFRDSKGEPLVERDEVGTPTLKWFKGEFGPKIRQTIERQWHVRGGIKSSNRTFIVTPNVVRETRAHFNCSELEGGELEDFERSGTTGSHWESRVYYRDTMKGNLYPLVLQMSRIDLAFLEDTGWYKVNYSLAEPMEYGKDLGCDFCMNSCKYWMDKKRSEGKSVEPFCDQTAEQSANLVCNKTEKIYSGCPLQRKNDPVPQEYQYFDKLEGVSNQDLHFYAGVDGMADYCPIRYTGYKFYCNEQLTPQETVSKILNPLSNIALEGYGNDSYCFESRTKWTIKRYRDTCSQVKVIGGEQSAGCYKYSCSSGLLVIHILNRQFPCFFEGQVLEVNLFGLTSNATHEGTIVCPSCELMCAQSSDFKCRPQNPNMTSKYPYDRDECFDGDYINKMIESMDEKGQKSSAAKNETDNSETMETDNWTSIESLPPKRKTSVTMSDNDEHLNQSSQARKSDPKQLIGALLSFLVIINYF